MLDTDRSARKVIADISCANSICFGLDGRTMYFTDMPTRRILAYRYDADTGTPHDPVLLVDGSDGPGLDTLFVTTAAISGVPGDDRATAEARGLYDVDVTGAHEARSGVDSATVATG